MTLKILNNTGVDLLINDITVRPTVIAGNIKGNTMSNTYFSSKDIKSSSSKITLIDVCSKFEDAQPSKLQ
ncbi:WSSV606 [White spot syndrome virus]|uniref:WSSV606 n=1 Tax=White spot syndrome virus TaxID=342409 RepID=A0A2I6SCM2_9VIRU|nr:WSSV606 [White spot syndrome virus]